MEITLKSGKVITYEQPKFFDKAEIKDLAVQYYNKGIPMSLFVCGKIAIHCKVATEAQLNNGDYGDEELYEMGALLLAKFYDTELTKKNKSSDMVRCTKDDPGGKAVPIGHSDRTFRQ